MDELKPCPACGGGVDMKRQGNDYTKKRRIVVRCPACRLERADAAIHHSMGWLEGVAAENWNDRPIEDALRAEIADLKAELAKYIEPLTEEQVRRFRYKWVMGEDNLPGVDAAIRKVRADG